MIYIFIGIACQDGDNLTTLIQYCCEVYSTQFFINASGGCLATMIILSVAILTLEISLAFIVHPQW